jgi:hypothetical protein
MQQWMECDEMTDRPILFSAPMIQALLAGAKTQTRRQLRECTRFTADRGIIHMTPDALAESGFAHTVCPYGVPGDRLWVREAWATHACFDDLPPREIKGSFHYQADGEIQTGKGRPSIHMPRWASRILLEVTEVRVERLRDISRGDAMAEGCPFPNMAKGDDPRQWYAELWNQINGPGSWDANPWVWVVSFRRVTP